MVAWNPASGFWPATVSDGHPGQSVLTVYSRRGCHLCEDLLAELEPLLRGRAAVKVVDIDGDPSLAMQYGVSIPVVCAGGRELCRHVLDRAAVLQWLDAS